MNKFIPYVLIVLTLLSGFYLKSYLDISDKGDNDHLTAENDNKFYDRFETILIYPKKNALLKFSLIDQNKKTFTNNEFRGKWNLIFTGYTNCPDVCPNTLNQLTQLYNLMDDETKKQVQIIFFSVDPERDTPEHLKQYLDFFHEDFVGISGEKSQIDGLIKALGGIYLLNKTEGEFYTVDHSARIFIEGPNAERYGILKSGVLKEQDKSQLLKELSGLNNKS